MVVITATTDFYSLERISFNHAHLEFKIHQWLTCTPPNIQYNWLAGGTTNLSQEALLMKTEGGGGVCHVNKIRDCTTEANVTEQ